MNTVTSTLRTSYSNSPVIVATTKSKSAMYVALTAEGNIYRMLHYSEIKNITTVEPFDIEVSSITVELLADAAANWNIDNTTIYRLAKVQEYKVKLSYSNVSESPLFKMCADKYYECSSALEYNDKYHKQVKESNDLRMDLHAANQEIVMLKAEIKAATIMTAKACTKKEAIAYALANKAEAALLESLFTNNTIHPNSYTGSGRYTSKGADKAATLKGILRKAGIKYTSGNDAPKGGFSGEFITVK